MRTLWLPKLQTGLPQNWPSRYENWEDMKKELLFVVVVGLILIGFDFQRPDTYSQVIKVEVLSLAVAPEGNGWRLITVKMPDGSEQTIKTLVPFFYKAGYLAHVGVFERRIFPDELDFVATPEALP